MQLLSFFSGSSAREVEQQRLHRRDIQAFHHENNQQPSHHSKFAHLALENRPFFHQTVTDITVQEGSNAFFGCKVENVHNQTVRHILQQKSSKVAIAKQCNGGILSYLGWHLAAITTSTSQIVIACPIGWWKQLFYLLPQVSWIRKRDGYMLYIGDIKFVDDERFELIQGNWKIASYWWFNSSVKTKYE